MAQEIPQKDKQTQKIKLNLKECSLSYTFQHDPTGDLQIDFQGVSGPKGRIFLESPSKCQSEPSNVKYLHGLQTLTGKVSGGVFINTNSFSHWD